MSLSKCSAAYLYILTVPLATDLFSLLPWWLLVMLCAAWQDFAWHANELGALCIMTLMSVVSLPVESVCVSSLYVVRCLPLSMLFTGNTQTSHPIAWSPPHRPPHKGTDTAVTLVHNKLICYMISFVYSFEC